MWIAILALAAFVAFIVVMVRCWNEPHQLIDYGEGGIRIRCPQSDDELILYGHGECLRCPYCEKRLKPPETRNRWLKG